MKNYDDKVKCKNKDKNCERMKKHLIVDLKKYNI